MRALVLVVMLGCIGPRPDPPPVFGPTDWLVRIGSHGADRADAIAVDHFGAVIVTGELSGQSWFGKRWGDDGSPQWTLRSDAPQAPWAPPVIDSQNNIIVAGSDATTHGAALAKLDREGTVVWRYDLGAGVATWIAVGADDRIYVSGRSSGEYVFVAALDPDGTPRWQRTIAWHGCTPRIAATDDGHLFAVATTQYGQRDTFGPLTVGGVIEGGATLVARFDSEGTLEWATQLGDPTTSLAVLRVARASADTVAILTFGESQLMVVDATGTPRWSASGADVPSASSMAPLGDGRIVLAGPSFVAAFDDTGEEIDRRAFGGVTFEVVAAAPDAGVVLAGAGLAIARLHSAVR